MPEESTTPALVERWRETNEARGAAERLAEERGENLDLVRSIYAHWQLGDFKSADWAHPEIEYVMAEGPAPGNWTGLAEMARAWGDFLSAWNWYRVEVIP